MACAASGLALPLPGRASSPAASNEDTTPVRLGPGGVWPSEPPPDCPFPASKTLKGLAFTGRQASYENADTWYPCWAADGNLYSPWTDGNVAGVNSSSAGAKATTGQACISGDSPLELKISDVSTFASSPEPYGGRYPCGSLVYNGVWYYGTYCLFETPKLGLNWDILGPLVGFRTSTDLGRTWTETPHTPKDPLFPEPDHFCGPVKLGAPHFADFGRNMEHSPDGYAYLAGHGAVEGDPKPRPANLSWITGDQIYLARVKPSPQTMNDCASWEYFGGHSPAGRPVWARDFARIQPVFEWNNRTGCVTITYNAPLKKYLMCVTDGGNTISYFNTYILEADSITGPWRLVTFLRHFGEQAYFVNFPSKFISSDGRTAWLLYAANFTNGFLKTNFQANPPGSRYGMCLQEVKLL